MPDVLFLTSFADHAHDYGVDHLFTGMCNVIGPEHVYDFPEKPCLHLTSIEERDICAIDSDAAFPVKGLPLEVLAERSDVAVVTTQPIDPTLRRIADLCRTLPNSLPIVVYDASDITEDTKPFYESVFSPRRLHRFFKRECSSNSNTIPLPLSYPASRVPEKRNEAQRIFYHASSHQGRPPSSPRTAIVNALRRRVPAHLLDVELYPTQQNRPSPEEYHQRMSQATVGIHWNGAVNWDGNRMWENMAYGLACVFERPRIEIPWPLIGFAADTPEHAADLAIDLVKDEAKARQYGDWARKSFLRHHSSEARAKQMLSALGIKTED